MFFWNRGRTSKYSRLERRGIFKGASAIAFVKTNALAGIQRRYRYGIKQVYSAFFLKQTGVTKLTCWFLKNHGYLVPWKALGLYQGAENAP